MRRPGSPDGGPPSHQHRSLFFLHATRHLLPLFKSVCVTMMTYFATFSSFHPDSYTQHAQLVCVLCNRIMYERITWCGWASRSSEKLAFFPRFFLVLKLPSDSMRGAFLLLIPALVLLLLLLRGAWLFLPETKISLLASSLFFSIVDFGANLLLIAHARCERTQTLGGH